MVIFLFLIFLLACGAAGGSGAMFLPYLVWVTIASALNIAMVRLNPDVPPLRLDQL